MRGIDPQGAVNLLEAMVGAAAWDVMHSKPGSETRLNAERFLCSEWFTQLTGLDGRVILRRLQAEYAKKHKPKGRRA